MGCKVRHLVQVSDQIFDATKESKFMFKQSDELILEVAWQMIKSACSIVRLILYSLPCIIIITRQQNLDEISVGEEAIVIRIEKLDELSAVSDIGSITSIFNELRDCFRIDTLLSTSVDAGES